MKEKIFQWENMLYAAVILCSIACLFFGACFFTTGTAWYQVTVNGFIWTGVIGSGLGYLWALRYVIGWIAKTVRYYVRRWRYGYGY